MRQPIVIEIVGFKESIRRTLQPDKFVFSKDRPHQWLQRICIFILRRLGCHAWEETFDIERYVIDQDKLMGAILDQSSEIRALFNYKPTRVLIGQENLDEWFGEHQMSQRVFDIQTRYHHGNQIYGLTVTVVPWMRGVLVMP